MIIIPKFSKQLLQLFAYSYQESEFDILKFFLSDIRIESSTEIIQRDSFDRTGKIFNVPRMQVQRLEEALDLRFVQSDDRTVTQISKGDNEEEGEQYKCIRLSHAASAKGCKNIRAHNYPAAFIKCALIANELNWFGSESKRGCCENRSWWNRITG